MSLGKEKVILTCGKDLVPVQAGLRYIALNALSILTGISVWDTVMSSRLFGEEYISVRPPRVRSKPECQCVGQQARRRGPQWYESQRESLRQEAQRLSWQVDDAAGSLLKDAFSWMRGIWRWVSWEGDLPSLWSVCYFDVFPWINICLLVHFFRSLVNREIRPSKNIWFSGTSWVGI